MYNRFLRRAALPAAASVAGIGGFFTRSQKAQQAKIYSLDEVRNHYQEYVVSL